ncbi:hypothetical protein BgiMline_031161, partial [Biomphalaria glabrata]
CFDKSLGTLLKLNTYTKESYSNCHSGFLDDVDRYIYKGTLNATSQDLRLRPFASFEIQRSSRNGYDKLCIFTLYPMCGSTSNECYCWNTSSFIFELFLNRTADKTYSNGTLRIYWPNVGSPDEISNEEPVPVIY